MNSKEQTTSHKIKVMILFRKKGTASLGTSKKNLLHLVATWTASAKKYSLHELNLSHHRIV